MKRIPHSVKLWTAALLILLLICLCACDMSHSAAPPTEAETTASHVPDGGVDTGYPSDTPTGDPDSPNRQPTDPDKPPVESDPTASETDSKESSVTQDTGSITCPHEPTLIPAAQPTCTQAGNGEGSVCVSCGTVLTSPVVIPATGHAYDSAQGCQCTACGETAICPTPLLNATGEKNAAWGERLNLSWLPAEEPLFPVVYMVVDESQDGSVELLESWKTDTVYSLLCRTDGAFMTLRVYACYAVNGEPLPATQSKSDSLFVTVASRIPLATPDFLFGNEISVRPKGDLTVAWSPVSASGASILYLSRLESPDGGIMDLLHTAETLLTIPGELLISEGEYTLTLIARDGNATYRDSDAVSMVIRVTTPVPEGEQDFTNPSRYASAYYYDYLATLENGENLRRFYRLVDTALTVFHISYADAETVKVTGGGTHYYAAKLDYVRCGLTLEEAVSVRYMYLYDHPLYYWVSSVYVYNSTSLYFCVIPDYATGYERNRSNNMVYQGVSELAQGITQETSAYNIALAYYERLTGIADYAYEDDGVTPQDDHWAHSVIGLFDPDRRSVVCEGFAEVYNLLLNYHGVENIPVPGESRGVGHLWNLVRLDDGAWYWCDVTWDDSVKSPLGSEYKYFCVTDTQDVLYYYIRDGIESGKNYTFSGSGTFMEDHTVRWDTGITLDMSGAIPDRSPTPYVGNELTLRETFTVDGMTYALTGYGKVQLTDVGDRRTVTVPETVTYNGVTYAVTSIGLMNKDGVFMTGRLLPMFASTVYVSKNVSYIWDNALSGFMVKITVDPENPYYTSENGTLKKK